MKISAPNYLFVSSCLVLFLCIPVFCYRGRSSRSLRATCASIYMALSIDHTMCLDDPVGSSPAPFSAEEQHSLVDQHNAIRAQEKHAAGMMKLVWDDDIASVAQKWAQQCHPTEKNEPLPIMRSVPSHHGIAIGQNVAPMSTYIKSAKVPTDIWYGERQNFEYGTGSFNGHGTWHYAQMVLEDVARIRCGRARCIVVGYFNFTNVVCNYAGKSTPSSMRKPFTFCLDASCKSKCLARDAAGLCDCKGKVCLNGGILDKATCTCSCPRFVSGGSCETVDCGSLTDKSYYTGKTICRYAFFINGCLDLGICTLRTTECSTVCQNGGTLNTFSCTCHCLDGWTGDVCEVTDWRHHYP